MMPDAMPRASSQALPQTGSGNARYERNATNATQLTQRVQDSTENTYVPDAAGPVDKGDSGYRSKRRTPRQQCACGCGFIANGIFRAGHRPPLIFPAGMMLDRALLIAIAVYDELTPQQQDAWFNAKSRRNNEGEVW